MLPTFRDFWASVTNKLATPPPVDPVIERLRQISQEVVAEKRAMDHRAQQAIHEMQAIEPPKPLWPMIYDPDADQLFPLDQRRFVIGCVTAGFDHGVLDELRRETTHETVRP
jgi:hypothetical protein